MMQGPVSSTTSCTLATASTSDGSREAQQRIAAQAREKFINGHGASKDDYQRIVGSDNLL